MMNGQTTICGAKTRGGNCCRNLPMKNGRCRLHGGKSTGPKNADILKGNRNAAGNKGALQTGEYETITWETLTVEEQGWFQELYRLQPHERIESVFEMESVRAARMLKRANEWDQCPEQYFKELIDLENALTRVSGRMVKMIEQRVEAVSSANRTEL